MSDDDPLRFARGIVWALPVSIALWCVILFMIGMMASLA